VAELIPLPSPGIPLWYGEAGHPLVVVLHDSYGRLPSIEPMAEALARIGFRVVVPDLFDGWCTLDAEDGEELFEDLEVAPTLDLLDELIGAARAEGSERVGMLGFSTGGWLALLHAQGGAADAVVAYYATLGLDEDGVIPNPVLLQFAETDQWSAGADPDSFVDRLTDHGTPVETFSYLATTHSFANASIAGLFDPNATALAFARSARFLEQRLLD
jgi:carboxymethylenebutenolidase